MRFHCIKAQAFGCLDDWESPPLGRELVLVCGRNESGKSTLFDLVATLLYGWSPASRDLNPYIPWDGTEAVCEGELVLGDNKKVVVQRRLRSTPTGMVVEGDKTIDLRNRVLSYVDALPREVFREVYAIELGTLKFPDAKAWESMQQQLLGGQFVTFLRPVNQVIRELEDEGNRLWRPDRRGKPRSKQIFEDLEDLRRRQRQAKANEEALYSAEKELVQCEKKLQDAIDKKAGLLAYIDRCERLNPVRKKLERVEELKAISAYVSAYEHWPADPMQYLDDLVEELDSLRQQLNKLEVKKERLEASKSSYTQKDEMVRQHADEIKLMVKSYDRIKAEKDGMEKLEVEMKSCGEQLYDCAEKVIQGGWRRELEDTVNKIDMAVLRAEIESFRRIEQQYQEQLHRVESLRIRGGGRLKVKYLPWISGILSAIGIFGTILGGISPLGFVSALMAVSGIVFLLAWWLFGKATVDNQSITVEEDRLKRLKQERTKISKDVERALQGLPLAPKRLEHPDSNILVDINQLKTLLRHLKSNQQKKHEMLERMKEQESSVAGLLGKCNNDYKPGDILEHIDTLELFLQEAEQNFQDAQAAIWDLKELEPDLSGLHEKIANIEEKKRSILHCLNMLPGPNLHEKVDELLKGRKLAQQAESILADLEREYPDLEGIKQEIEESNQGDEEWILDDEALGLAKAERDQIEQKLNDLNNDIGTLKKEIELGMDKERLDEIEGEMAFLNGELERVTMQRDRIFLLKNLFIKAEKRFREEHQPDVLKKAGKYLSIITEGRYTRLFTKEGDDSGLVVKCEYNNKYLDVHGDFLSRGTLEQIYLALRLAFVEHLDPGGHPLPVFLDEVFVNWDGFRLNNGIGLLNEMANDRQVFIFTCHEWLVEKLAGNIQIQVVEL